MLPQQISRNLAQEEDLRIGVSSKVPSRVRERVISPFWAYLGGELRIICKDEGSTGLQVPQNIVGHVASEGKGIRVVEGAGAHKNAIKLLGK